MITETQLCIESKKVKGIYRQSSECINGEQLINFKLCQVQIA